ncbi:MULTISPECIES: SCO2583 family membrane protein [unclassified Streptomyces]|uniref:SCO2583 family membrane protein n=1 Tax=unclassified Streptomyces TaxID=2593676 RepID=UPI003CFA0F30
MGGPGDPPEGTPEGAPGGGEDEYRSVVFDESFVRAARLQEYSAQERMADHAPAVRRRPPLRRGLSRQALVLVLLIAVAFGTAIYMGVRHPYQTPAAREPAEPLRMTVIPLVPEGKVPGAADPAHLYAHSPAAQFKTGAEGVPLPASRRTAHFSDSQVVTALSTAKDYVVRSALDPEVITGGEIRAVRVLLDSDQLDQFDQSFARPTADGRHAPTGWLVRLDPSRAELADRRVRVHGTLQAAETDASTLEVTADHTFVYALRPAGAGDGAQVSLFTVRRELQFRFDRDDLRLHQAQLVVSYVQAGPLSCAEDSTHHLRPLLAGQTAKEGGPAGTDPYATGSVTALCGSLATSAQPKV